jgi:PQQ-dependent catabolism-associated CXXCW motif protein
MEAIVMIARSLALIALLTSSLSLAQVTIPPVPEPVALFADEDRDWNIAPTTEPKKPPYHAPTPRSLPGGRIIKTLELKALLDANKNVLVIDVLDSKARTSIPGAYWMHGAGSGQFFRAEKFRFAEALDKLSGGDKARPIVFLCISSECWLSYNASLHAIEAGYKDVIWYRGGTDAWRGASLPLKTPERINW